MPSSVLVEPAESREDLGFEPTAARADAKMPRPMLGLGLLALRRFLDTGDRRLVEIHSESPRYHVY